MQPDATETPMMSPHVVIAFTGWSDAADAASEALEQLATAAGAVDAFEKDMGDYLDYQMNRPHIVFDEHGQRIIEWPTVRFRHARLGTHNIVLIDGDEPNLRWRAFCDDLARDIAELQPKSVIFLGAHLADVPHTRPTPVLGTSTDRQVSQRCGFESSTYEGPTGIVGVLGVTCAALDLPVTSLWAAVPHYVAQAPNPKAVVALLNSLEDVIGVTIGQGEYAEDSRAWQRRCDELVEGDQELADYITALEQQHDEAATPEETADSIAREFERYLRRRDSQD